jgi:hypothetical protein
MGVRRGGWRVGRGEKEEEGCRREQEYKRLAPAHPMIVGGVYKLTLIVLPTTTAPLGAYAVPLIDG